MRVWRGLGVLLAVAVLFAAAASPTYAQTTVFDLASEFTWRVGEGAGTSVASAGDVNGDGVPDALVGVPGASNRGRAGSGSVLVIYGGQSGVLSVSGLTPAQGYRIDGAAAGDSAGQTVASAGDVNADGVPDQLIGAPEGDAGGTNAGSVYVVYGGQAGPVDLAALTPSQGYRIDGANPSDGAGFAIATVGDVDGDAVPDHLIAAPDAVTSYLVYGGQAGPVDLGALAPAQGYAISGAGSGVAAAGDVNGDGTPDMLIGRGTVAGGSVYVLYGGSPGPVNLTTLTPAQGYRIDDAVAGELIGYALATVGDLNADGVPDHLLGARGADYNGRLQSGSAYVVFGGPRATPLNLGSLTDADGYRIDGAGEGDILGWSVAAAGDVDGDGTPDLLLGAPGAANNGSASGSAYVVYAGSGPLDLAALMPGQGFRLDGPAADMLAGLSVASAGDVDGDGLPEQLVGAPSAVQAPGSAYLFGRYARAEVAPATLDFGAVPVGARSPERTVRITNRGARPLRVGTVVVEGPFASGPDGCSGRTLGLGASCAISVTFQPADAGPASGRLAVPTSDAARPTVAVALTGSGTLTGSGSIECAPPTMHLQLDRRAVRRTRRAIAIGGRLFDDRAGGCAGTRIDVLRRYPGSGSPRFRLARRIVTGPDGRFAYALRGRGPLALRFRAAIAPGARADLRVSTRLRLVLKPKRRVLRSGGTVRLRGRVRGAHHVLGGQPIRIEARTGTGWRIVGRALVRRDGRFAWRYPRLVGQPGQSVVLRARLLRPHPAWPWSSKSSRRVRVVIGR